MKLQRKSLKTIPLNDFMGQVRCILLSVNTGKSWSQNKYTKSAVEFIKMYHTIQANPWPNYVFVINFTGKGLRKSIHDISSKYHTCQFLKHRKRSYGKLLSM